MADERDTESVEGSLGLDALNNERFIMNLWLSFLLGESLYIWGLGVRQKLTVGFFGLLETFMSLFVLESYTVVFC